MNDGRSTIEHCRARAVRPIKVELFPPGNDEYAFKRLLCYAEGLFTYSKFKLGDMVRLNFTPVITEDHAEGWLGSKHFLKKGCRGIIESVDYDYDGFTYQFVPFKQTWIDNEGKKHKVGNQHSFGFSEKHFTRP